MEQKARGKQRQEEEKMPERERRGMKQGGKKADMSQGKNAMPDKKWSSRSTSAAAQKRAPTVMPRRTGF